MTSTLTRLYDDYDQAAGTVRDLEAAGFSHSDISIVGSNADGRHGSDDGSMRSAADTVTGTGVRGDDHGIDDKGDVSRGTNTGAVLGGVGGLLAGLGLLAIPGLGPIVAAGWLASTAAGAGIGALGGATTGGIVGALRNAGHSDEDAHTFSEGVRRGGTLVSVKAPDSRVDEVQRIMTSHQAIDTGERRENMRARGWTSFDETAPAYTRDEQQSERVHYVNR